MSIFSDVSFEERRRLWRHSSGRRGWRKSLIKIYQVAGLVFDARKFFQMVGQKKGGEGGVSHRHKAETERGGMKMHQGCTECTYDWKSRHRLMVLFGARANERKMKISIED